MYSILTVQYWFKHWRHFVLLCCLCMAVVCGVHVALVLVSVLLMWKHCGYFFNSTVGYLKEFPQRYTQIQKYY